MGVYLVWLRGRPSEAAADFAAAYRAQSHHVYMREASAWDGTIEHCDGVYLDGDGMELIASEFAVPVMSPDRDAVEVDLIVPSDAEQTDSVDPADPAPKPRRRRRKST